MIKEDKRRQPQNQALCVRSYESKYKLNSILNFEKVGLKLMRNTQNTRPQQVLRMSQFQCEHLNYDISP